MIQILRAVYPEEASIMAEEDLALLVEALVQAALVPLSLSSQVLPLAFCPGFSLGLRVPLFAALAYDIAY